VWASGSQCFTSLLPHSLCSLKENFKVFCLRRLGESSSWAWNTRWHHSVCLGAMSIDQIYLISNYDFGHTIMWIFKR
jgi:hypothetical protein